MSSFSRHIFLTAVPTDILEPKAGLPCGLWCNFSQSHSTVCTDSISQQIRDRQRGRIGQCLGKAKRVEKISQLPAKHSLLREGHKVVPSKLLPQRYQTIWNRYTETNECRLQDIHIYMTAVPFPPGDSKCFANTVSLILHSLERKLGDGKYY